MEITFAMSRMINWLTVIICKSPDPRSPARRSYRDTWRVSRVIFTSTRQHFIEVWLDDVCKPVGGRHSCAKISTWSATDSHPALYMSWSQDTEIWQPLESVYYRFWANLTLDHVDDDAHAQCRSWTLGSYLISGAAFSFDDLIPLLLKSEESIT